MTSTQASQTTANEVRLIGYLVGWCRSRKEVVGSNTVVYYDFESVNEGGDHFSTPCLSVNFSTGEVIIHKHIPSAELGWDTRPESLPKETTIISLLHDLCLGFSGI